MANTDKVPLPPPEDLNSNLTSPTPTYMTDIFGTPGNNDEGGLDSVTSDILRRHLEQDTIQGMDVVLLSTAADRLRQVFQDVTDLGRADLLEGIKTAGTLVVRGQRDTSSDGDSVVWSNHAFGIAIDLYYGDDVIDFGVDETYQGILDLYPHFHNRGWYWGGGYHDDSRKDSMHFELSEEVLNTIKADLV